MLPMVSVGGGQSNDWTGARRQHLQFESWHDCESAGTSVVSDSASQCWLEQQEAVITGSSSTDPQQDPNAAAFRTQQHMGIAITINMAMER